MTKPGTAIPPLGGLTVTPDSSASSSVSSSSEAGSPESAQLQLTVPPGSPIRTVVIGPCEAANPTGPAEQVLGAPRGSTTSVAPKC